MNKLIMVCTANHCRSPMAESIAKKLFTTTRVISAGVSVKDLGYTGLAANANAVQVAKKHGLSLQKHQAKQLTPQMCQQADFILVMEPDHIELVGRIEPMARSKTFLIGQWIGKSAIDDPHKQDVQCFLNVFKTLVTAIRSWKDRIE